MSDAAGGLVGSNFGFIIQSHATGNVLNATQFSDRNGGLVGASNGTIALSYATGSVTHTLGESIGDYEGGLVGLLGNSASIDQSFATGEIAGTNAGGLVGASALATRVSNSYATGAVFGGTSQDSSAGGLEGELSPSGGTIASSYSTGAVSAAGSPYIGGFLGYDGGETLKTNTYWDLTTSGLSDPGQGAGNIKNDPGITGLTDAQLKSGLPDGFDPNVWGQNASINNGYPYLLANPPPQ